MYRNSNINIEMSSQSNSASHKQYNADEDRGQFTRQLSSQSRFKVDARPTKMLCKRVDEFRIEVDEMAFTEHEYDRRRRRRASSRRDRHIRRWRRCYLPAILLVLAGSFFLFVSSIDGFVDKSSVFRQNKLLFQCVGGAALGLGSFLIVLSVVCIHHREDFVKSTAPSLSYTRDQTSETNDQLDGYFRLPSSDSGCPESPADSLAESFRSFDSAGKWISEHRAAFKASARSLRRVYSDTALNENFSKARLVVLAHNYPGKTVNTDGVSEEKPQIPCDT
ncbi:hypothetical protein BgiMline_005415 [Biomphalaria glabrata]|nr:hypothetical protein BgiMline_003464 [Biomphalaria glabrata]